MHIHNVKDMDKHYAIDPITMIITKQTDEKNTLNLGDHNSEIYTFEVQKEIEGHDLSLCDHVSVHFVNTSLTNKNNKSDGIFVVRDIKPSESDENTLLFTWTVSGDATKYAGTLHFRILFACTDKNNTFTYKKWTDVFKGITVKDGFENGEVIESVFPEVLSELKAQCQSYIDSELLGGAS